MTVLSTKTALGGALAATLALAGFSAQAHTHLVKASPAANAVVHSPGSLHLQFSEKLVPKFSGATLMQADGKAIDSTAKVSGKTVDVKPKGALTPGAYMVMWNAVSADGHKMKGQYSFTVK